MMIFAMILVQNVPMHNFGIMYLHIYIYMYIFKYTHIHKVMIGSMIFAILYTHMYIMYVKQYVLYMHIYIYIHTVYIYIYIYIHTRTISIVLWVMLPKMALHSTPFSIHSHPGAPMYGVCLLATCAAGLLARAKRRAIVACHESHHGIKFSYAIQKAPKLEIIGKRHHF